MQLVAAVGEAVGAWAGAFPDPGNAQPGFEPPAVAGTPYAAPGSVHTPAGSQPIAVVVSDDPYVRIQQAKSMFLRNPGVWKLTTAFDGARNLPYIGKLAGLADITSYGVGQYFVDQVRWQIRTGRQPLDAWWMTMNKRSLEDPLLAEAYIRAGRERELDSPVLQAWADYFHRVDAIKARIGVPIDEGYRGPAAITRSGDIPVADLADGTAAVDESIATRLNIAGAYHGVIEAYWTAHNLSIQTAAREFRPLLDASRALHPTEAEFQDNWARFINVIPHIPPPGTGGLADALQGVILAQQYPATPENMTATQKAFVQIAKALGRKGD